MRLSGRKDKCRVKWLVEFLKAWYSQESLTNRIQKHIEQADKGELNEKSAYYLTEAMAQTTQNIGLQDILIKSSLAFLEKSNSQLAKLLTHSDIELLGKGVKEMTENQFTDALKTFQNMSINKDGTKENIVASLYLLTNDNENAKLQFKQALKYNNFAMLGLANIYLFEKDYKEADNWVREYFIDYNENHNELISHILLSFLKINNII